MRFVDLEIEGAHLVQFEPHRDERGAFMRTFCAQEFAAQGLKAVTAQMNLAMTRRRGTLRGLHYQLPPAAEAKLFRCSHGVIFDVVVDLRPGSPTRLRHTALELSSDRPQGLYIPEGCAHGYLTLTDQVDVVYQVSAPYAPAHVRGIRYDDPLFGIRWPIPIDILSSNDASWPRFDPDATLGGGRPPGAP